MSSGDYSVSAHSDKYGQSIPRWNGPKQSHETSYWQHDAASTVVEVTASAGDAAHRDELFWSVIVRPDGRGSPGRRITQSHLDSKQGAVERAQQFMADQPDGDLPTSSFDEWGCRE